MRRNLRTYISIILIAFPSTLIAQGANTPVRPGTILLSAYQTVSDAEKLEKEKAFKNAWNKYHQALRYYESLAAAHPAWKPHIVHGRIDKTKNAIKRVEPAAQKAFMAEQAQLQHLVIDEGSEKIASSPTTLISNQADLRKLKQLNDLVNSQHKQLESLKNKHTSEKLRYTQRINKLQTELRKNQQGLGKESTQTIILNGQIARLQQELRKSQQLGKNNQQQLLSSIEELQRTRTALATAPLRADVDKLKQQDERQKEELILLAKAHRSAKKSLEIKTLENQKLLRETNLTKGLLEKKTANLEASQTNTAAVVATMRREINSLKGQLTKANTLITSQKGEISDLVNRLADSESLSDELRRDLAEMTTERDQLSQMLKLSDANRAMELMKENLRLGRELSTAKQHLAQLNADKNSALDRVTKAENDVVIAKHQFILKRQENTAFRKRISKLESTLKSTQEQLAHKAIQPLADEAAFKEAQLLKKTVNRLISQSSRRRQAVLLLWEEYQRTAVPNPTFEKEYLAAGGEELQLTQREREILLEHKSEGTLHSPLSGVSRQNRDIAQQIAKEKIGTYHAIAKRLVEKNNLVFAKDIYDEAYDAIPDYSFLINRGVIRMRLGEIEDAEAIFELGTSQRPLSPYTHFMLGMSRFKQDNDDLAAKSIDRAIDLKPDYKEALLYRGIIEAQNARYTKALDLFQNAVEIDPEYGAAYYNIAQVHSLKGDKKKAREVYNNGLRAGLAPDLDFEHKIGINKASP